MSPKVVSATEAARKLGELLARVRYRGESFLIKRGKDIVAELRPAPAEGPTGRELAELFRERVPLGQSEAERLDADLRAGRKRANKPPKSSWPR